MDLGEGLKYIETLLRKEIEGNVITPNRYQNMLQIHNRKQFDMEYKKLEVTQGVSDSLRPFISSDTLSFTNGICTNFPSDYYHAMAFLYGDVYTDIVTQNEWAHRKGDVLTKGTVANPMLRLTETQAEIQPNTITSLNMDYLKAPSDPIFDYCYDGNDVLYYIPVEGSIDASGNLKNASGTTLATGCTSPNGGNPYTGTSVELEWDDDNKEQIYQAIVSALAASYKDAPVAQYSISEQQKQASE